MSDSILRRLSRYKTGGSGDRIQVSMPLPETPSGLIEQYCPNESCRPRLFQLHKEAPETALPGEMASRARRQPGMPATTCPYCGHDAEGPEFVSPRDRQAVLKQIEWMAAQDIADEMERITGDFNRKMRGTRNNLISLSMSVRRPRLTRPHAWREDLLRVLTCDTCGRGYGVYAIALFCPDCGARNVHVHFAREVQLVGRQCQLARHVGEAGEEELAYRLLGNAHEDVLTAFETYLKTLYRFLARQRLPERADELVVQKAIGNRFQNLDRGRKLFETLSIDPYGGLTSDELEFMRLNIEKRHVIGHNLSMADEKYAGAAESGEGPGETVRLLSDEVERFANLCGAVITSLTDACAEFRPRSAATDLGVPKSTEGSSA